MAERGFFIKSSSLEYFVSDKSVSSSFIQDETFPDVPSVTYLSGKGAGEIRVPATLFGSKLAPLQSLVKYLREIRGLSNSEIARLLGRKSQATWLTYRAVSKKPLGKIKESPVEIPVSAFSSDDLSILECVVSYLRRSGFTFAGIAGITGHDQRTIWTAYDRARKKLKVHEIEG